MKLAVNALYTSGTYSAIRSMPRGDSSSRMHLECSAETKTRALRIALGSGTGPFPLREVLTLRTRANADISAGGTPRGLVDDSRGREKRTGATPLAWREYARTPLGGGRVAHKRLMPQEE